MQKNKRNLPAPALCSFINFWLETTCYWLNQLYIVSTCMVFFDNDCYVLGDTVDTSRYEVFQPSSYYLYCLYSIFICTCRYCSILSIWISLLAILQNTPYLVHEYWWWYSIFSISKYDTCYIGQYSLIVENPAQLTQGNRVFWCSICFTDGRSTMNTNTGSTECIIRYFDISAIPSEISQPAALKSRSSCAEDAKWTITCCAM